EGQRAAIGGQLADKLGGIVIKFVAVGDAGVSIRVDTKIRAGFVPDIVGFGWMNAGAGIEVVGRVGNLCRIGVARGDEAVDIGRGRIAKDLLRAGLGGGLGEVVVFHGDNKDIAHSRHFAVIIAAITVVVGVGQLTRKQNAGNGGAEQRGFARERPTLLTRRFECLV